MPHLNLREALIHHAEMMESTELEPAVRQVLAEAARIMRDAAVHIEYFDVVPFGWFDHFNQYFYRDPKDARAAVLGGNKITPLYERIVP